MNNSNKKILFDEQERNLVESVRPKKTLILKEDSADIPSSHTKIVLCSLVIAALLLVGFIVMAFSEEAGGIIFAVDLFLCLLLLGYIIYHRSRDYSIVYADNGEVIEYSGKEIKRNHAQYHKKHKRLLIFILISALAVLIIGAILGAYVISSYNSRDWDFSTTIWTIILSIDFISSIVLLVISIVKANKLYDKRPKPSGD